MRHMLDTNIVSHLFKRHPEVVSRMTCLAPGDVCISSITEAELLYGADKKKSSRVMGDLDQLIAAHAISRGTTIVTNDRAFRMVQELAVEDWTTTL
ncbi:PIN domain-containing protein [Enterobacter roggenkampii]|uniref:PIN domain-containing protein n=1 Tax=Enterobacter roggenkampii TaxID=1812935 RepID=UPI002A827704|nr:PIN domain-containing protein [Enterobacter roggenkampii]